MGEFKQDVRWNANFYKFKLGRSKLNGGRWYRRVWRYFFPVKPWTIKIVWPKCEQCGVGLIGGVYGNYSIAIYPRQVCITCFEREHAPMIL